MVRLVGILIQAIRWTLLPIFVGLLAMLILVCLRFLWEVWDFAIGAFAVPTGKLVLAVLSLLDLALIANLIFLLISSARTSLLSRRDAHAFSEALDGVEAFDLAELKLRILNTIAAIAAIALLEDFTHVDDIPDRQLRWLVVIFVAFVVAGPLLALGERLSRGRTQAAAAKDATLPSSLGEPP
jgi:uncharacterized protein (TIGR00645 family)